MSCPLCWSLCVYMGCILSWPSQWVRFNILEVTCFGQRPDTGTCSVGAQVTLILLYLVWRSCVLPGLVGLHTYWRLKPSRWPMHLSGSMAVVFKAKLLNTREHYWQLLVTVYSQGAARLAPDHRITVTLDSSDHHDIKTHWSRDHCHIKSHILRNRCDIKSHWLRDQSHQIPLISGMECHNDQWDLLSQWSWDQWNLMIMLSLWQIPPIMWSQLH